MKHKHWEKPWSPFEKAVDAHGRATAPDGGRLWKNSRYTVTVRDITPDPNPDQVDRVLQLSIKRNDKRPIFDWREIQRIKNELVGEECEAVQIFPAESRLVDTANQYWIYAYPDPKIRVPFGFQERLVSEGNVRTPLGTSIQRPFEPGERPGDCVGQEEAEARIAAGPQCFGVANAEVRCCAQAGVFGGGANFCCPKDCPCHN